MGCPRGSSDGRRCCAEPGHTRLVPVFVAGYGALRSCRGLSVKHAWLLVASMLAGGNAGAQGGSPAMPPAPEAASVAERVYAAAKPRLLQIRTLVAAADRQSSIGSGFLVSADGLAITNYHVVSQYALEPATYRLEYGAADQTHGEVKLLAIDVANDLALVRVDRHDQPFFGFDDRALRGEVPKGERLYSMGNPLDLGFTIVEGTYNGLVDRSYNERIHFSGAINPGMSGGPTVTAGGHIVGINVSKQLGGELVSFLVPARFAAKLLANAQEDGPPASQGLRAEIGRQLTVWQEGLYRSLRDSGFRDATFGPYKAPESATPWFTCWAQTNAGQVPRPRASNNTTSCSSDTQVFVATDLTTGGVRLSHSYLSSIDLNQFQFAIVAAEPAALARQLCLESEVAYPAALPRRFPGRLGGAAAPACARLLVRARLPRVRGAIRRLGDDHNAGPRHRGAGLAAQPARHYLSERDRARQAVHRSRAMEEVVWIEVVSRSREVLARHRCAGSDIRIGRGYDNDVVLDDPYVAPRHLRIRRSASGTWVAEDLGSGNGLFLEHGRNKFGCVEIDGNRPIRIGHTYLRLREASHAVAPERAYQPGSRLWPVLAGLGALLVAIEIGTGWLGETSEPKLSPYLVSVLTVALFLAVWTAVWSVLTRIFSGQARFERNFLIALAGMVIYSLYREFTDFAAFAFSWRALASYRYIGIWSLLAAVCFLHLREVSPAWLKLKAGLMVAVLATGIGVQLLNQSEQRPGVDRQAYDVRLLPPEFRLAPLRSEQGFFADIEALRSQLDNDRTEPPSPAPSEGLDVRQPK